MNFSVTSVHLHVCQLYSACKCVPTLSSSAPKALRSLEGIGSVGCKGVCCVRTFTDTGRRSLLTKEGSKALTHKVAAAQRTQLTKAYVAKTSCNQLLLID